MLGRLVVSARARLADRCRVRLTATRDRLVDRFSLPDKYKGGLIEKWAKYWRQLGADYAEVIVGCARFTRAHPVRAAVYAGAGGTVYQCAQLNPNYTDYLRELRYRTGDMVLVDERCQRPETREYLRTVERHLNEGRLRHIDLGVASLIWQADYDAGLALYKTTCTYTVPHWREFGERIVDVGFCGRWWLLRKHMEDYDVVD